MAVLSAAWAEGPRPPEAGISIADYYKQMEASPRAYELHLLKDLKDASPRKLLERLYPARKKAADHPWVTSGANGKKEVSEAPLSSECQKLLTRGEALYENRDFESAAPVYREALAKDPKCYLAHTYLGECLQFKGLFKEAEVEYLKAIDLNPNDHRAHFFRASGLQAAGRTNESIDELVTAFMLRPHYPEAIEVLKTTKRKFGVRVDERTFQPRAFVELAGKNVRLYFPDKESPWMLYAIVKAIWLGEPEFRKSKIGHDRPGFSNIEEIEALSVLIGSYDTGRAAGKLALDPELERLSGIAKQDLLSGFVFYEFGARIFPQVVLTLPSELQEQVRRYVKKYVLN